MNEILTYIAQMLPAVDPTLLMEVATSVAVAVGLWVIFYIFRFGILTRLSRLTARTTSKFDDTLVELIEGIPAYFYLLVALLIGTQFITLHSLIERVLDGLLVIVILFQATHIIQCLLAYAVDSWWGTGAGGHHQTALHGLKIFINIAIWSSAILLALSNLGFQVSTLVASLGIGGVAVAFALQKILADIFSSFSIYFDQPFQIGDYIVIGEHAGTVKKIGLKTTRIQLLQGEELVISNAELTSSRIQNFKKLKQRRARILLGVTYDTKAKDLKKIPDLVAMACEGVSHVRFDRAHFAAFGDFSLNFEVIYFVDSPDYIDFMDAQQAVNLGIVEAFEKAKIEIAFPTQTVYLKK